MRYDIYFSALPRRRSRHHMSSLKPSRGGEACGMTYNRAYACVAGSVAVHTGQECSLSDIHACRPSHMGLARMRCRRSRPCSHTLAGRARFQHAYSSWASPRGTDAPGLPAREGTSGAKRCHTLRFRPQGCRRSSSRSPVGRSACAASPSRDFRSIAYVSSSHRHVLSATPAGGEASVSGVTYIDAFAHASQASLHRICFSVTPVGGRGVRYDI